MPRIRHETCGFPVESNERDACRSTHEGPAEAEVLKLHPHDRYGERLDMENEEDEGNADC
jgi:hypothetical protein